MTHKIINTKKKEFLNELFKLYDKYGYAISHEDGHGGFIIEDDDKHLRNWMKDAMDNTFDNMELKRKYAEEKSLNLSMPFIKTDSYEVFRQLDWATEYCGDCSEEELDKELIEELKKINLKG